MQQWLGSLNQKRNKFKSNSQANLLHELLWDDGARGATTVT